MNRLAWAFLAACLVLGAAQTIQLSQIVSQNYQGVMVTVPGKGWQQATLDGSLQITPGNPPTLISTAGQGSQGIPGPVGPAGPTGAQGIQGVQGIQGQQGLPGTSAPVLPITVTADGGISVKSLTTGATGQPTKWTVVQSDGTSCLVTFQGGLMKLAC